VATDFEHRSFAQELALCQRYYCKSYNQATAPATATDVGTANTVAYSTISYAGVYVHFKTTMRTTPTVTLYSASTGATGKLNADSAVGNAGVTKTGESGFLAYRINDNSGVSGGAFMKCHYQASAEL